MLNDQEIPKSEPEISVGIILPEDAIREITVEITSSGYLIWGEGKERTLLNDGDRIKCTSESGTVLYKHADGEEYRGKSVKIRGRDDGEIGHKTGLLVHDVIAGRDFHWKKTINVYLPGHIEIKAVGSELVLINHLPFEHYLMCVSTSEMGAACPPALIEAQTIAARSWMLANVEKKHRTLGMDVCNDDCCQRYQGTNFLTPQSITGARNTYGTVALFQDKICDARYSKSCGGMMESFETIWGGTSVEYLQVKRDFSDQNKIEHINLNNESAMEKWLTGEPPGFCSPATIPENGLIKYLGGVDEKGQYYRWHHQLSQDEMRATLKDTLALDARDIHAIRTGDRGGSGRLKSVTIEYTTRRGEKQKQRVEGDVAIRAALHKRFLYSSAIVIEKIPAESSIPDKFIIRGAGWGHGVGLCQIGALGMALNGYESSEIIQHYYPGCELVKLY
ncbi:MAG: SpoIID/LytB domain-containing protein [Calditrichaeota bacterium]|nr:MAG: SpoIID/LytB domain-containing protein [Calditrichota bacterium]